MTKKTMRRLFTASVSCALMISVSSCSAAKDNVGKLNEFYSGNYASVSTANKDYSVTYKELWDELKWNTSDVLTSQISNVILNKYIKQIDVVVNNDKLTKDEDKELLGYGENNPYSDEAYAKTKSTFEDRLVDYVVYDIYNITWLNDTYWKTLDEKERSTLDLAEAKYVDKIYSNYNIEIDVNSLKNADYKNYQNKYDTYLDIAKKVSQKYYVDYAKELLAYAKLNEDVAKAAEEDDDPEDSTWGKYTDSKYVDMFKSEYTNNYDQEGIIINFTSSDELNETLRAFGLKLYNKNLYYIYDSKDEEKYTLVQDGAEKVMKYEDYISYYDDFKTSDLGTTLDKNGNQICTDVSDAAVLEIFIQIYNYVYGGYRTKLASNNTYGSFTELNSLRKITEDILLDYATDGSTKLNSAITKLQASNADDIKLTSETLEDKYGSTFKTYFYETLTSASDDMGSCYTTSSQSTDKGSSLAYKLSLDYTKKNGEAIDEKLVEYVKWYNKDLSTADISAYLLEDENKDLYDQITQLLIKKDVSLYNMDTYYNAELEETEIKIYNEACEIAYSAKNTDYSKAIKKNKNSNVLATIKYEDVTWNVNICKDDTDDKSTVIPGSTEKFGVFEYLEEKSGATTATDLIFAKIIKDTDVYASVLNNKEKTETFETYIESVLLSFSNDGLSSAGYSSSIGKYNFLQLYYHTADIKDIVANKFCVQYAASALLMDYSNDDLLSFIQNYTNIAAKNYFNLEGKRILAYIDIDEDGKADTDFDWDKVIDDTSSPFNGKTFQEVAKDLIYTVYTKIAASTDNHATKAQAIIDEYNDSAKVAYNLNPISPENDWAKYKHLGISIKLDDVTATNATTGMDNNLKQRLYDYATGVNSKDSSITYDYFFNKTAPTCFIENVEEAAKDASDDTFFKTIDGYNLLIITTGTSSSSAKFTKDDYNEGVLEDIKFIYNDNVVEVSDIFNDTDDLNKNQILYYLMDIANNDTSSLMPTPLQNVCENYLLPITTKLSSSETQKIIQLTYMANLANKSNLYDVVDFASDAYEGVNGRYNKLLAVQQNTADEYLFAYNDTTGTSDIYSTIDSTGNRITWWAGLENLVKEAK